MEKIVQTSHINQIQYLLIPLFTFITNNFNKKFCFELLLLITVCVCVCVCVFVHARACSVLSDLYNYGLQPTRLLFPWNFPSTNTGVSIPTIIYLLYLYAIFLTYFPCHG